MRRRTLQSPQSLIYLGAILTICSLYAAQPIQPVFQQEFGLTGFQAVLFTTLMMLPLGFAPLAYGFILESFSAKHLLRGAVLCLGLLELAFSVTDSYLWLLLIRGAQGFLIPAILTSLMSYIAYISPREEVQQAIASYIGATILGGFLGRFLSGLFTDLLGWRFFFVVLGGALLFFFFLMDKLERDVNLNYSRPDLGKLRRLLANPPLIWLYSAIFCIFYVFAAVMNFLPFELKRIDPNFSESGIGLFYLGYSMGLLAAANAGRMIRFFGSEVRAVRVGLLIFGAATLLLMVEVQWLMGLTMFAFCFGMFMAHSLLSGYVNRLVEENRGLANGLYISCYYLGGTIGSFAPGIIFQYLGWRLFLASLLVMLALAFVLIMGMSRAIARNG